MNEYVIKMLKAVNQETPKYDEFKAAFDNVMIQKLDDHFESRSKELFSTNEALVVKTGKGKDIIIQQNDLKLATDYFEKNDLPGEFNSTKNTFTITLTSPKDKQILKAFLKTRPHPLDDKQLKSAWPELF